MSHHLPSVSTKQLLLGCTCDAGTSYICLSNIHAGWINVRDEKKSLHYKRAGWNFPKITTMENVFACKFSKINKRAGYNKSVQIGFFS